MNDDLKAKRAMRCVAALHKALRMARKEGGRGVTVEVDDLLTLLDAYESGSLDAKLDEPTVPVTGPFYPNGVM